MCFQELIEEQIYQFKWPEENFNVGLNTYVWSTSLQSTTKIMAKSTIYK